jgi:hypothetical protein
VDVEALWHVAAFASGVERCRDRRADGNFRIGNRHAAWEWQACVSAPGKLTGYSVADEASLARRAREMLDAIPSRAAAAGSRRAEETTSGRARRGSLVQCRQCTEHFPRHATVFCPRCSRLNDRSAFILGLKVLALVLFVATVSWTAWAASNVGDAPPAEGVKPLPKTQSASAGQPDLRF